MEALYRMEKELNNKLEDLKGYKTCLHVMELLDKPETEVEIYIGGKAEFGVEKIICESETSREMVKSMMNSEIERLKKKLGV